MFRRLMRELIQGIHQQMNATQSHSPIPIIYASETTIPIVMLCYDMIWYDMVCNASPAIPVCII
jgi:hypothetical protein